MSKKIDERVVSIAFENAKFEAGVAQTMKTLQKLNESMAKMSGATGLRDIDKTASKVTLQGPMSALDKLKTRLGTVGSDAAHGFSEVERSGSRLTLLNPLRVLDHFRNSVGTVGVEAGSSFSQVENSANRVNLSPLSDSLAHVTNQFSILKGAASVALGNIASQAMMRGTAFAKSFAFGPLMQGLEEYQTNLQSIQTIMANTEGQRVSGLKATNKALGELNTYSDQTIYNFSQMAKNIGTFTAAGVDLPTATASIKGIANLAALSGSSSQQASTAMYQLSQAIAAGRVSLQDWNSVVNAGMGGAKFQKALMTTAENMGALKDGAVKIDKATGKATVNGKSFRESIMAKPGEQSWLSSEILTSTLKQFTGDLSNAELAAQGFTKEQIKAIQATAKSAKAAATEVKTLPQVFDVAKETIGSGWAKTFQLIFGDFNEAKKTFTGLSNFINGFINKVSDARNKVLKDWKKLGGRTDLIKGIRNAFDSLMSVVRPLRDAFRDIFPATTGKNLADITKQFRGFMDRLKIGPETAEKLRRTFRGLFALLDIGKEIVFGIVNVFGRLFGAASEGSGGFSSLSATLGDLLVALHYVLIEGGLLERFFDGLHAVLSVPLALLGDMGDVLANLFGGDESASADDFGASMRGLKADLEPVHKALDAVADAWERLLDFFDQVKAKVSPWLDELGQQFSGFGDVVVEAFKSMDFDRATSIIEASLIGGIFIVLKRALAGGINFLSLGGGFDGLNDMFGALTKNLQAMQKNLQAKTLLSIAAAIGILAIGVTALSMVDPKDLAKAMTAVAVGMTQLVGVMAALGKINSGGKLAFAQLPIMATGLVVMAGALILLAGAVYLFSRLSWEELAKGLVGVGAALFAISVGTKLMGPSLAVTALGLIPVAIAMNLLALAVKQFADMSWEELARGVAALGAALVVIGIATKLMGPSLIFVGPGLVAVAIAMNLLAGAILAFGSMKLETLGKGIGAIAAALVAIGLAISLIPPTVALQAAGLVILSIALAAIAGTIAILGSMDIGTLVKGIGAMGIALGILAAGLYAMTGTLPGAVALVAAAAGLAVLAPTLAFLGVLKWSTIITGLIAIAAAFGVLALVGTFMSGPLTALGIALLPLAAFFVIAAGAAYIFAKALALLGTDGSKGLGVMVAALTAFVALLPKIVIDFAKGLIGIVVEVAKLTPKVVGAIIKILGSVIEAVIKLTPRLAVAIVVLVSAFLKVISILAPRIVTAGLTLVLSLLKGIDDNISLIVSRGVSIVTKFLDGLAVGAPKLVASGVRLLLSFISGITSKIPSIVGAAFRAVTKFITSVATKIPGVISAGASLIVAVLNGIAQNIGRVISAGARVIFRFLDGIAEVAYKVPLKAAEIAGKFVRGIARGLVKLADEGAQAIIDFLNGMAHVIRVRGPEIRQAGWNVADAIIDGMIAGFKELGHKAIDAVGDIITALPKKALSLLDSHSPSKVFMNIGRDTMAGLVLGIAQRGPQAVREIENTSNMLIGAAERTMNSAPNLLDGMMDVDPKITPVLDLTAVQKDVAKLGKMTEVTPITVGASFDQAAAISEEKATVDATMAEVLAAAAIPSVSFEQNNYSPEALPASEIYRQTRNQFSLAQSRLSESHAPGYVSH